MAEREREIERESDKKTIPFKKSRRLTIYDLSTSLLLVLYALVVVTVVEVIRTPNLSSRLAAAAVAAANSLGTAYSHVSTSVFESQLVMLPDMVICESDWLWYVANVELV